MTSAENLAPEAASEHALGTARDAQQRWALTPLRDRLSKIRTLRGLIAEHCWELAEASATVRQRPAQEMLTAEVLPLAEACRFLEREACAILAKRRVGRSGLPIWLAGIRTEVLRDPLGVVLILGPGNYPLLLPGVQLIQALVAGNAVLLKPAAGGVEVARVLLDLLLRAGFEPSLVTLLPETTEAARAAIESGPDKVIFTGSAATGEIILSQLARHLTPATMELSGCDAVIVRDDADIVLAAKSIAFGLRLNNGATCMAPKRVYVSPSRVEALKSRLIEELQSRRVQNEVGDISSLVGASVTRSPQQEHLFSLVMDAISQGATIIHGSLQEEGIPTLPLILADVAPSSKLLGDDIFLPVLAIVTVATEDEAITQVNACSFALSAAVFSRDEHGAQDVASRIRAGVVTINDLIIPTADARLPFGGRGRSGFGVTRGREGLLELTTPKVVTVSRAKFRPALEVPHPHDADMFEAYFGLSHGRGIGPRFSALLSLLKNIMRRATTQSTEVK